MAFDKLLYKSMPIFLLSFIRDVQSFLEWKLEKILYFVLFCIKLYSFSSAGGSVLQHGPLYRIVRVATTANVEKRHVGYSRRRRLLGTGRE